MKMEQNYLKETAYYNTEDPFLKEWLQKTISHDMSEKEKAKYIYLGVRDGWRYAVFPIGFMKEDFQSSELFKREKNHCVGKAILMISALRAVGIPSRIGLCKVRNHIAAENLIALTGTDVLAPHAFVESYIDNKWVKATPAFDKGTCDKYGVEPLAFNGETDSLFQAYDISGEKKFMEYLSVYGSEWEDFPQNRVIEIMADEYGHLADTFMAEIQKNGRIGGI